MSAPVCIFGGTFDPIHNGHMVIARLAAERFNAARMVFVTARVPPHKEVDGADAKQRLEMVRLATADVPGFEASDMELRRPGPSYAIDTIRQFRARFPGSEIAWLLGSDSTVEIPAWRVFRELVEEARLITFRRGDLGRDALKTLIPALGEKRVDQLRADFIDGPIIDLSSTMIRRRAHKGLPLHGFVPDSVRAYIENQGLYLD